MSEAEKPKFGHEMRLLAASLLSMGVILLWTKFFAPKPPASLNKNGATAQSGPAVAGSGTEQRRRIRLRGRARRR